MDDKAKLLFNQIEEKVKALAEETDKVRFSLTFLEYLSAMSRFHHYSFTNSLLIHLANPKATQVAGFKDWQRKFNRTVKKGEHGIPILAPVTYKKSKSDDSKPNDTTETSVEIESTEAPDERVRTFTTFRTVYVFDVSQTEGDPLPVEPNWHDHDKNAKIEKALYSFANNKGIKIEVVDNLHGADGVSKGGKIKVVEEAGTRTLVHELAHEILHWRHPELKLSHTQEEIEADATAYVVAQHFNMLLEKEATPNYLALSRADGKSILSCFNRIRDASIEIIQAVENGIA